MSCRGPPRGEGSRALADLCSTVADVLDEFGVGVAVGASILRPLDPRAHLCGPAITIRYGVEGGNVGSLAARGPRSDRW